MNPLTWTPLGSPRFMSQGFPRDSRTDAGRELTIGPSLPSRCHDQLVYRVRMGVLMRGIAGLPTEPRDRDAEPSRLALFTLKTCSV